MFQFFYCLVAVLTQGVGDGSTGRGKKRVLEFPETKLVQKPNIQSTQSLRQIKRII